MGARPRRTESAVRCVLWKIRELSRRDKLKRNCGIAFGWRGDVEDRGRSHVGECIGQEGEYSYSYEEEKGWPVHECIEEELGFCGGKLYLMEQKGQSDEYWLGRIDER